MSDEIKYCPNHGTLELELLYCDEWDFWVCQVCKVMFEPEDLKEAE